MTRDWKTPPKLRPAQDIISDLKAGKHLNANITEIQSKETAAQLRTLWHSYGCKEPLTLLLTREARETMGATATRIRLARGTASVHIEEVALLALGNGANWILPPVKVETDKIKTIERSTLRVIAPLEYRKLFLNSEADRPNFVVSAMAQWNQAVRAASLTGGRWDKSQVHRQDLLTGWLTIPTKDAVQLAAHSGNNGVFAHIQDSCGSQKHIRWFQRSQDESPEAYLQKCLKEAKVRKSGLFFRKSSTPHNVGIAKTKEEIDAGQVGNFLLRGAPKQWASEEIIDFLTQQNWKTIERVTKSKFKPEWRFHALPPNANQDNYHYQMTEGYISCLPAPTKRFQPTWQQPVRNTWRGCEDSNTKPNPRDASVAATRQDSQSQASQPTQQGGARERQRSRSPAKNKSINQSTSLQADTPVDIQTCLDQGWYIQDVGGEGDCFYRSVAACRHMNKHQSEMSREAAALAGAELRAQAVGHAQKHQQRLKDWFAPDSEETRTERGGLPQAKTIEEWCEQQMQQTVYADGLSIQCLSERLGLIIVVFKESSQGSWDRFVFAPGFSAEDMAKARQGEAPVVLKLQQKHFQSVHAPKQTKVPRPWLFKTKQPLIIDLTGGGRTHSIPPASPTSLRTYTDGDQASCSKDMPPDTPSAHTWVDPEDSPQRAGSARSFSIHTYASTKQKQHRFEHVQDSTPSVNVPRADLTLRSDFSAGPGSSCDSISQQHRKRLNGKQPNPIAEDVSPATEEYIWTCRLCHLQIQASSKRALGWRSDNHFRSRHPGQKQPEDRPFKPPVKLIQVSSSIPVSQRIWTCAFCDAGLASCRPYEKAKAVSHHYQTVHRKRKRTAKTIKAAHAKRRKLQNAPISKPSYTAILAANRDMSRNGHKLVSWEPHMPTFPGRAEKYAKRFTCTKCWLRGKYDTSWDRNPCTTLKAQGQWPDFDHKNKKILADLWGVTVDEAELVFEKLPQHGAPPLLELAEIKGAHDLVEWDPPDPLPSDHKALRATCRQCWKMQVRHKSYWQRNPKCSTQGALYSWWPNLSQRNKQSLATIWGVTLDEAKKFFDQKKSSKKKLAEAKFKRLSEQGIEPNPGPSADTLRDLRNTAFAIQISTLNVQGVPGAWRALNQLTDQRILLLQDTPFSAAEFAAFKRAAAIRKYSVYWQPGTQAEGGRRTGGITTLIPKHLNQQIMPMPEAVPQHVYMHGIHVHGVAIINFYAPPGQQKAMADFFLDTWVRQRLGGYPWLAAGDSNETQVGHIAATMTQLEGVCLQTDIPTRWDGRLEIDWFATNRPHSCDHLTVDESQVLSDHKIVSLFMRVSCLPATRYRYKPQPVWKKPSFLLEEHWHEFLGKAWQTSTAGHMAPLVQLQQASIDVDLEWKNFMTVLSQTYKLATSLALEKATEPHHHEEIQKSLRQKGIHNGKGIHIPSLQQINNTTKTAGHLRADLADRKIAKKLAKLHEFRRLAKKAVRDQDVHYLRESSNQLVNLANKIWPRQVTLNDRLGSLILRTKTDIDSLQSERNRLTHALQQQRWHAWQEKMQQADVKTIGRWLRSKENPHVSVNVSRHGEIAQNNVHAAEQIYQHWQSVWHEPGRPDPPGTAATLTATFPTGNIQPQWRPPDLATFTHALLDARGTSGCDQWSSDETKYMPIPAIQHLHTLTQRWCQVAAVPHVFSFGRQINLAKPNKVRQGIIDAADMRPITVFSIFWRAYATAWTKTPEFQQFAQQLPQEVAGLHQHEGAEEAASVLQQHLVQEKGTLISLDYSQCYDRMDVQASTMFLSNIQWPAALISQMQQVWHTQRFLEFDGHIHPTLLQSSGIPQGCPLAPLTLACWMSSGIAAVNRLMQTQGGYSSAEAARAKVRVYMDDRSWVDSDYQRSLSRADQWLTWSTAVGLRENVHKAQACSKLKRQHAQLRLDRPDWCREDAVKVLGVSLRPRPMANTELEQTRLRTAIQRAKLLSCLPVAFHKKIEIYRVFCLPKALYGWVSRFPPNRDVNLLFNSLSKMTGSNRVASPILRSVLYGGSCHLQVLVATRLFKRLCRMKQRNTASWSNAFGTPAGALRRWLKDFGWTETGQWKWTKEGESLQAPSHTEVDRQMHQIRMSWRLHLLRKFAGHTRHEAAEWRRSTSPLQMREEINQVNLEAARKSFHAADSNGRAILLGSIVSPAYLGRAKGEDDRCPWCGKLGTFMHIAWHCRDFPDAAQRPSLPTTWLERRLAWPQHTTSMTRHKQVLQWLAHVQQQVLLMRHGSARA